MLVQCRKQRTAIRISQASGQIRAEEDNAVRAGQRPELRIKVRQLHRSPLHHLRLQPLPPARRLLPLETSEPT